MYKTEKEQKLEDEANKYCYMNRVIDNLKVKQQNGRLWTPYHDMQLYEYVIKYNFNFYEISNAFQKLCINDKKYEYSEDAVRLHWAFLHAMRNFNQTPDEAYYQRMKLQYDKEKPKTFKNTVEEREKMLSEEEDIKRMKEELEKMQKEKEEKEKKIKEEKEKKEKERLEKEKKEEQEVEELISTTKKRNETNEEEEEKQTNLNNEGNDEKNKEENIKANNDNKLYDENNEPEYIKQLFSNKIPQEILDKLNRDQGKYNNNTNTSENNNIINDNNIKENKENAKNELKKENEQSNINNNNIIVESKDENKDINKNLDINKEISKKENENNKINNIDDDEDLFPIKSNKQKDISEPGKIENINMEQELRNTQDFNDYIQSNPELKKQYEQLNNYCNFAVKSLNYIVNKGAGVDSVSESEAQKIEQTNRKLNEFLLEPIIKRTEENGLTLEDWNKKIEEEENKMTFETTNYDNYMKNAPKDEERDMKLNKFKEHLFGFAEKISTEELLEKITGIISQSNIIENNNQQNENQANNNNIINNNNNNSNNNNINLENQIQNFMNNLENNNIEDEKSENTKEQSESITENNADDNGRNTISSIGSEIPKKYRHVYRGIVYYSDKPDENDKRNRNNRNVNNKKKKDEDDEIEEDDDDDDDYNK